MRRRDFLLAAPAGALAACGGDPDTHAPAGDRADLAVLGLALALEEQTIALYERGARLVAGDRRQIVAQILEHERAHAQGIRAAIEDLRGRPPRVQSPAAGLPRLRDERAFLEYARDFERRAAEAYRAALPKLKTPRLRGTLGSILAVEAEHASVLARELGDDPLERVLPL